MTCFETVEADLTRYYQTDLCDALWGEQPMTVRRLNVLVKALPPESATARDATHGWGAQEELLATLCELVDRGDRWFYQAHTKPNTRPPEPITIPRPGRELPAPVPSVPRRTSSPEQIRAAGGKFIHTPGPVS